MKIKDIIKSDAFGCLVMIVVAVVVLLLIAMFIDPNLLT